jgi:hypothetical protein
MPAKQILIIQAEDHDLLIEGSPRSAKSWGVAAKIHLLALQYPGIQIFYSRYKDESLGQLRDVWQKVQMLFPEWSWPAWNSSDQSWDYPNPEGTPRGQSWGSKVWLSSIKSSDLDLLHSKYKGKTLAVIVVEEAAELPYENFVGLQERLSQSKKPSGEPFRYPLQFILVTNSVDEDHWIAKEYPQDGIDPITKRRTIRFGLYDNARNLGPDVMMEYERRYPIGHPLRRTVIDGNRGLTMIGKPVYGDVFDRHTHVSADITFNPYYPLLEGWDFGNEKPAVVWWQYLAHIGAIRILGGVKGSNLFLETFAPKVLAIRRRLFPQAVDVWSWADPTGSTGNQGMQHTAIRHLHDLGIPARYDPTANNAAVRYAAVQVIAGYLERVAKDGTPAFQMVPTIIELERKDATVQERETDLLVTAFGAGYVWDEHAAPDANPNIRKPRKGTRYDDLMNAGEYIVIGERLSVPLHAEMWQADRKVAALAERVARAAVASTQRVEGPSGETLSEAEARMVRELKQYRDSDRRDHRQGPAVGNRGGYG